MAHEQLGDQEVRRIAGTKEQAQPEPPPGQRQAGTQAFRAAHLHPGDQRDSAADHGQRQQPRHEQRLAGTPRHHAQDHDEKGK